MQAIFTAGCKLYRYDPVTKTNKQKGAGDMKVPDILTFSNLDHTWAGEAKQAGGNQKKISSGGTNFLLFVFGPSFEK